MMALTGDTSDNVPGMRSIGPKKALKMLQSADWDLDRAMEAHPDSYAIVKTSQALVDLTYAPFEFPIDVPVFTPTTSADGRQWDALLAFCDLHRMATVRNRLIADRLWR